MSISIRLRDVPDSAIYDAIAAGLAKHNTQQTGTNDRRPLILSIEDEKGSPTGGLWGRTVFGWLFVELLFVPEPLRLRGLGTDLMLRAEREALARGCHSAWLDTFDFQARGFYERLGYSCFATLQDYPVGFSRFFMKKTLIRSSPAPV